MSLLQVFDEEEKREAEAEVGENGFRIISSFQAMLIAGKHFNRKQRMAYREVSVKLHI